MAKDGGYIVEMKDCTDRKKYYDLLSNYNSELEQQVANQTRHISYIQQKTILGMASMVENRDNNTGGHIKRTSDVIGIFVDTIKSNHLIELSDEFCEDLIKAAPMHDLGKIGIKDSILQKPGRFTDEEFEIMKTHAEKSAEIIEKILRGVEEEHFVNVAANVARYHHEKWNGQGYPMGLSREKIPLEARIMAIADVYDALTSKRPYKDPYTPSEAIEYLMGGCNILFDESIVRAFMKCVPVYPKGATITLSDNRLAVVYENNPNPLRPKVKVETGEIIDLGNVRGNLNLTVNPTCVVETNYSNEMSALAEEAKDGRKRILIADNDVESLSQIKNILEKDYHVRIVKNGEEVLRYISEHDPIDLLMIDVDLAKMNGIETVGRIRDLYGEPFPVMFLSTRNDRATVEKCRSVQAVDYILKPFQPIYVLTRVKMVLEGWDDDLS